MQMWLFFLIFGSVIFIPTGVLFLILQRFRNTIIVLIKQNGALKKIVITNKTLEKGQITDINGKKIKPIKIDRNEIWYGKWRRWIVKSELESKQTTITDSEIEQYLNSEDLIKLYLAGKFKDTLFMMIGATIGIVIIGFIVNGYLLMSIETLEYNNQTSAIIYNACKKAIIEVVYNASG